jgi:hypothetical protein
MGQLTEKMWPSSSSIGPFKFTCLIVAAILWTGALGSLMVNYYSPPCSGKDMDEDGDYDTLDYAACDGIYYNSGKYAIASFLAGIFGCGMCVLTTLVRSYIRKRDNIPVTGECRSPPHVRMRRNGPLLSPFVSFVRDAFPSVCAGLDDVACAVCCLPCVQCQLMRHEGMTSGRYSLASSDGTTEMV